MAPIKPEPVPNPHWQAAEPEGTEAQALNEMVRVARGPLDEEDEPDVYDLMMSAPNIADFEPCDYPCHDPNCLYHHANPPRDP